MFKDSCITYLMVGFLNICNFRKFVSHQKFKMYVPLKFTNNRVLITQLLQPWFIIPGESGLPTFG